jgi:hypothetical protein
VLILEEEDDVEVDVLVLVLVPVSTPVVWATVEEVDDDLVPESVGLGW